VMLLLICFSRHLYHTNKGEIFFIIPYLIKDYCNLPQKQQTDLGRYLYDEEHELMWELASKYT
jgi:hypothetical protein